MVEQPGIRALAEERRVGVTRQVPERRRRHVGPRWGFDVASFAMKLCDRA